jgi:hypothetical protein
MATEVSQATFDNVQANQAAWQQNADAATAARDQAEAERARCQSLADDYRTLLGSLTVVR